MYPQAERKVMCHFPALSPTKAATHVERDYIARQVVMDAALHRVNKALVDNQDVTAPPFLRARVTMYGSIIFTTTNTQKNIIDEDYTMIIADALSTTASAKRSKLGSASASSCSTESQPTSSCPISLTASPPTTPS